MRTNITSKLLNALKFFVLAAVLSFGLSYALAWTPPTSTPPAGNVDSPINTSTSTQIKLGSFTIGTTTAPIVLTVTGLLGATGDICTSVTSATKCLSNLTDPSGILIRAIHTFKDCTTAGGAVYNINEAKNICRFASILSGWTQYPSNWSTTQNVYGDGFVQAPNGWNFIITQQGCNTGSHTFSDTPTESCTGYTYGKECRYVSWKGLKCWEPIYYVTYYATVIERGAY